MREIGPITRTFRRLLRAFTPFLRPNWWYRRILYLFRRIYCLLTCVGEYSTGFVTVKTTMTLLRSEDSLAKQTEIANTGTNEAVIYEAGILIGLVQPQQTFLLPVRGRYLLEAKSLGTPVAEIPLVVGLSDITGVDPAEFSVRHFTGTTALAIGQTIKVNDAYFEITGVSNASPLFPPEEDSFDTITVINPSNVIPPQGSDVLLIVTPADTADTTLVVTTLRRCLCGDDPPYIVQVTESGDLV